MIHLHLICPWNRSLGRARGKRYIEHDGHRYTADLSGGVWSIWEVGDDGLPLGWREHGVRDEMLVGNAFNLPGVRLAIELRLAGKGEDEIRYAVHALPPTGTGRNSPDNVARRRSWRGR